MKRPPHCQPKTLRHGGTRGFALTTLLAMLALASMATLLAMRNLWLNAQLLNAEADQLRTQHKAEAALPIALNDLLGIGQSSSPDTFSHRHHAGTSDQAHAFFPTSMVDYDLLRQRLNTSACSAGICAPNTLQTKPHKASDWKMQIATAMPVSANQTPYGDQTAWYWVEVFPLDTSSPANHASTAPFVYRITTLAKGLMPGSTTVLQAIWLRDTPTALTGQWHSWYVLQD
ncbi:hypothetical protein [Limnohabitans sp.]|uniref:hypothetical protein n=1 Tax=Limnohabitans sp. TaxID=1907725 RepID=UPI002FDEEFB7